MCITYIYIYIIRICVRCAAGWMCCALFYFLFIITYTPPRSSPLYLYLYLPSPNFLSIISLFVTRWMQMETVIFARFARFVLLLFLSLVVRTAELDGGCMRLSRDHM